MSTSDAVLNDRRALDLPIQDDGKALLHVVGRDLLEGVAATIREGQRHVPPAQRAIRLVGHGSSVPHLVTGDLGLRPQEIGAPADFLFLQRGLVDDLAHDLEPNLAVGRRSEGVGPIAQATQGLLAGFPRHGGQIGVRAHGEELLPPSRPHPRTPAHCGIRGRRATRASRPVR